MSNIRRLAVAGIANLAIWCLVDVAYVKAGQPQSRLADVGWSLLYAALPVTFFVVLRSSSPREHPVVAKSLVATLVWGILALVALAYFHIAIGGRL